MVGTICKRDILAHPIATVRCFGWMVFFRALTAGPRQTFLSILIDLNALHSRAFVEQCVSLELRAMRIYELLAQRFHDKEPVRTFFENLVSQEQDHAELLRLCQAAVDHGCWEEKFLDHWKDVVPQLEQQMREAEAALNKIDSVADALRLVIDIESSEVNRVFMGVVMAADSTFVTKMNAFWNAGDEHISYIRNRISDLEPSLAEKCEKLKNQCLAAVSGG